MELRLSDADRARYGGDEWLTWDGGERLSVSEAELLQEQVGVSWAVYRGPWLNDRSPTAVKWAFWLSLRRTGVDVPWAEFDPDLLAISSRKPVEPEGKDPSSTPPSPSVSDDGSTPPP
jgi:hypothetical protein